MIEIKEGTIIEATAPDGTEVHGFAMFDENMNFFITGEKPVLLDDCTNVRISEAVPKAEVIDQILNADIKKVDPKKIKDPEKVGADREKELIKMKVLKGNEDYKSKFAAGVAVAKAVNGNGAGLFNKSCLDKYRKKEDMETMANMDNNWENFKEGDTEPNDNIPLEGDTVIGEKPIEVPSEDTPTEDIPAGEPTTEEPVAPITDMTVNNTLIDTDAKVTTPQIGDDVISSSDSITDYSQFLDEPAIDTEPASITTPEEDNIITDAITSDTESTVSNDDVQITIQNPSAKTIEIKISGEKEDALNNEIDAELDNFSSEDGYSDESFFEHLCKKYNCDSKALLKEGETISQGIYNLIKEVAAR